MLKSYAKIPCKMFWSKIFPLNILDIVAFVQKTKMPIRSFRTFKICTEQKLLGAAKMLQTNMNYSCSMSLKCFR